jgi:hypothetical protein
LPLIREVPIPSDEEVSLPQPVSYYYLASEVDAERAKDQARIAELEQKLNNLHQRIRRANVAPFLRS